MTKQEALEIKAITDQCLTTIPSQYVDFIYVMYTTVGTLKINLGR